MNALRSLICQVGLHNRLFSLSSVFYDLVGHMVETEVSSRVGTRVHTILQVYTAGGSVLVS